jgi:hypothetical protein
VLPRVWYGTACLLIRDVVGCESYSAVWGNAGRDLIHKVQEGLKS